MNKYLIVIASFFVVSAAYLSHHFSKTDRDFRYFSADCSIFDRSGKIVFHSPEDHCDFASDGKLLSSVLNTNTLQLRDRDGSILWTSTEYAHHDLKFSRDEKSFLVITAESIDFRNKRVKSDCFAIRDLNNKPLYRWCLSDHVAQLESLGLHFNTVISDDTEEYQTNRLINSKFEISHANSIYEIPKNRLSEKVAALAEGNFLINIYSPSFALIILDREMKNILWAKDLGKVKHNGDILRMTTHDIQLTEDGKLLTYVNFFQKNPQADESADFFKQVSLVKIDPITGAIDWLFKEKNPRQDFKSLVHGTVTILKNSNLFYSVVSDATNKSEVYEISKEGQVVWSFNLPNAQNTNPALRIKKAKPVYDLGFLQAREILN